MQAFRQPGAILSSGPPPSPGQLWGFLEPPRGRGTLALKPSLCGSFAPQWPYSRHGAKDAAQPRTPWASSARLPAFPPLPCPALPRTACAPAEFVGAVPLVGACRQHECRWADASHGHTGDCALGPVKTGSPIPSSTLRWGRAPGVAHRICHCWANPDTAALQWQHWSRQTGPLPVGWRGGLFLGGDGMGSLGGESRGWGEGRRDSAPFTF